MLHGSCSSAARPLQYYCISHAALLQRPCSRTAKAVQQTCRGEAEKPPRQGSPPVAQSVPSGQVRSAQGGREESGCLPLGIVHGPGTCVLFLPQKTVVRVQSVFRFAAVQTGSRLCRRPGHVATKRQPRCRWQDGKRLRKAGERPSGTRQGGLMSDLG